MATDPYKYPSKEAVGAATDFYSSSLKRPNVFGTPEGPGGSGNRTKRSSVFLRATRL